jgi:hypothetical protein
MIRQSRQNIGEPSLRVNIVEFAGLDQCVDCCGPAAALV